MKYKRKNFLSIFYSNVCRNTTERSLLHLAAGSRPRVPWHCPISTASVVSITYQSVTLAGQDDPAQVQRCPLHLSVRTEFAPSKWRRVSTTLERRWFHTDPTVDLSAESGPSQAPIQDAHGQTNAQMCQTPGLVCGNGPEGHIPSCLYPSSAQTISSVCLRRSSISVKVVPFGLSLSLCEDSRGCPGFASSTTLMTGWF